MVTVTGKLLVPIVTVPAPVAFTLVVSGLPRTVKLLPGAMFRFVNVAEGVCTPAQRDFLLGVGCRLCQGELFGNAVPAAEIDRRLRAELAA